jgi:hypothetical protein
MGGLKSSLQLKRRTYLRGPFMEMKNNFIIVCQPSLPQAKTSKFYILESIVEGNGDHMVDEMTLIGDIGVSGHIVGIENTYEEAEEKYKQLLLKAV